MSAPPSNGDAALTDAGEPPGTGAGTGDDQVATLALLPAGMGVGESSSTGGGGGDGENLPSKRKRRDQTKQKIVDGQVVCVYCSAPIITDSARRAFCEDKQGVTRCRQLYHDARQRAAQQAATAAAGQAGFEAGMQHQAALQQQQQLDESGEDDENASTDELQQRPSSLGFENTGFCTQFNRTMLDRELDGWQQSTYTLPISLKDKKDLLMPFLAVSQLQRSEDALAHVLLPGSSQPWSTTFKNKTAGKTRTINLAGFDSYAATQHAGESNEERDNAQRRNIVMFLPWCAWTSAFPPELLPHGFADSASWAAEVQGQLLGAVKELFTAKNVHFDDAWEILYMHVLDQSVGASRFRMHRDVEEDSNMLGKGCRLRVQHTVVLLLHKEADGKKVPGMYVAGALKAATYNRGELTGHVFNSALWHQTQPMSEGECSGVKLGIFIGNMF